MHLLMNLLQRSRCGLLPDLSFNCLPLEETRCVSTEFASGEWLMQWGGQLCYADALEPGKQPGERRTTREEGELRTTASANMLL